MPAVDFNLMGMNGGVVIDVASSQVSGDWRGFLVVNDAVFLGLVGPVSSGSTLQDLSKLTDPLVLPAGLWVGGKFSSMQLTQGVVIAYDW